MKLKNIAIALILCMINSAALIAICGYKLSIDNTDNQYRMYVEFVSTQTGADFGFLGEIPGCHWKTIVEPWQKLEKCTTDIAGVCVWPCYRRIYATVQVPIGKNAKGETIYRNGATFSYGTNNECTSHFVKISNGKTVHNTELRRTGVIMKYNAGGIVGDLGFNWDAKDYERANLIQSKYISTEEAETEGASFEF